MILSPSKIMIGSNIGYLSIIGQGLPTDLTIRIDGVTVNSHHSDAETVEASIPFDIGIAAIHTVEGMSGGKAKYTFQLEVYAAEQGPNPFGTPSGYFVTSTDSAPAAVLISDLNGDGRGDVVVPGTNNERLYILNGRADGTLEAPETVPISLSNGILAGDDIDGDGDNDIVVASSRAFDTTFIVLQNDGRENFSQVSTTSLQGYAPTTILLEDMNGDNRKDLLLSVKDPAAIYMAINKGGSFGAITAIAALTDFNRYFSVVDLDGDTRKDIVYSLYNSDNSQSEIRLLLQQPDNSFRDVSSNIYLQASGEAIYINAIDFDKNDRTDLVLQIADPATGVTLNAYRNLGNAQFSLTSSELIVPISGFNYYNLVKGDFDKDGNPDLAGVNAESYPAHVMYLWGTGTASFSTQFVIGPMGIYSATGDINADGISDIVIADPHVAVTVIPGKTDRDIPSPIYGYPNNYGELSSADVDGDGYRDLLVGGEIMFNIPGTLYLNDRKGGFEMRNASIVSGAKVLGDLNGDGHAELLGANRSTLLIWSDDGNADFSSDPIELAASTDITSIKIMDMDRDGRMDVVAGGREASGTVFFSEGSLSFTSRTVAFKVPFLVGDCNKDGVPDIVSQGSTFLGSRNRDFLEAANILGISDGYNIVDSGDFNGDGSLDVAFTIDEYIIVAYGRGDGSFYWQGILSAGGLLKGIAVGDFNGDGRHDIVAGLFLSHQAVLFSNYGDGTFLRSYLASGVSTIRLIQSEFNNDGKPDLAFTNYGIEYRPPNVVVIFAR